MPGPVGGGKFLQEVGNKCLASLEDGKMFLVQLDDGKMFLFPAG